MIKSKLPDFIFLYYFVSFGNTSVQNAHAQVNALMNYFYD